MSAITIAIDGHSSCGKSTLAKELARELGYVYVDTGAMYRAATLFCIEHGWLGEGVWREDELLAHLSELNVWFKKEEGTVVQHVMLGDRDVTDRIRTMEVSRFVSQVSTCVPLREKLVKLQREMGKDKGIVMDGRDIGTVVFPDAEVKIFMTASVEERARRRFLEIKKREPDTTIESVLENIRERDRIDSERKVNPLRQPEDAHVLDNTHMNREEQFLLALSWARGAGA
ncbi:MAG: (d)CMP kinase [Flavobacteriales bacterium]|nr:(d)CMP kinase [Flavobacteriales bacterium]MCB9448938.1 (d)CMP kinase [Flavobacteriales bacterium]